MSTLAERAQVAAPAPDRRTRIRSRARFWDRVMTGILWAVAIGVVVLLLYIILAELLPGLSVLSWKFLTTAGDQGGIAPEIFNTFYIIILALIICIPFAMGAAIYLVEYAKQGPFVTVVRFATETLAGVPSLILSLFGFLLFVTQFGEHTRFGFSRLAGALTIAILNLPLMLRVTEDALRSVPNELREASVALGANKFKTVARVMLPTALPAITTGVVLTIGKMVGETAALIYTSGLSSSVNGWFSLDPLTSGDTLTVHLYALQSEPIGLNIAQQEAGTATLLILFLLLFNLGFRYLSTLLNRRLTGSRAR